MRREIDKKMTQIWALTRKNLELYFNKGPVIIFGILFPFFMALAWILGRAIPFSQLFSGILGMSVFFMSTAISPVIFPWETREKNLELIFSSPISLLDLIMSINLASTIFSFFISTIIGIFMIFILGLPLMILPMFLLGNFLLSWIGSNIGVLISAVPTDMTSNIMTISSLVKFPLIFISGIFIPLNLMPTPLYFLSLFSPITYFTDLLNSIQGVGFIGLSIDLIVLLIFSLFIFGLAYKIHKKTILQRFSG